VPHSHLGTVLVTDDGTVLEPPESPLPGASIDDQIANMRAFWEFNDRVTDRANRAFERAFRKAIRKP
jgi:hypothetical protein